MTPRGVHEGVHELLAEAGPPAPADSRTGAAAGYSAMRTLSLRAEVGRQLRRRRTQLAFGFLALLPFLLVLAFTLGRSQSSGGAAGFVDLATSGSVNFTLFTLYVATSFLLVVVVALFAGDTVASEASWSSLRYLLAAPVPRPRLLRQKLVVALASAAAAVLLLTGTALLAGWAFFGWAPVRTPYGALLSGGESVARLGLIVGYLLTTSLMVASIAFLLGVCTDAPLGAVGGAVLLVILSSILDAVDQLGSWRQVLPTHYQFAWTDALQPDVVWDTMTRGALVSVAYAAVLLTAAWIRFMRKDVVS